MAKRRFQWVAEGQAEDQETEGSWRRASSRSARKRQAEELSELVRSLLALKPGDLEDMPLNSELRNALAEGRRLQEMRSARSGRRRQLLHLSGLLRREEPDVLVRIRELCEERGGPSERELKLMQAERWRERLLAGGDADLAALIEAHPGGDHQRLRQLIRAARKEQQSGAAPRAFRQLFAALREQLGV